MTFADIVRIVVRRWPIVLVITLAGAVLGGGFAARAGTTYTATSTLIINPSPTASRADLVATNSYIQSRMDSYRSMATTSKVLGPVAERLNLGGDNDVASMITVQVPTNSTMVSIAAESPNRQQAVSLSNEVVRSLSSAIREVSPSPNANAPVVQVVVLQNADDAVTRSQPPLALSIIAGLIVGLIVGVIACHVADLVNSSRRRQTVSRS